MSGVTTTARETARDASGDAPAEEVPQKGRKTNKAGENLPWSCEEVVKMAVRFKAKVVGDIPARRMCILGGRDENNTILLQIADNASAVDFVTTKDLKDGELTTVTLHDGVQIWTVDTAMDVMAGQWVSCREDGKVGARTGNTVENVGFTLEAAKEGQAVRVVRRESFDNIVGNAILDMLANSEASVDDEAGEGDA